MQLEPNTNQGCNFSLYFLSRVQRLWASINLKNQIRCFQRASSYCCSHQHRMHPRGESSLLQVCTICCSLFHIMCLCGVGYGLVTAINPCAFKFLCLIVFMCVNELFVFENSLASNGPLYFELDHMNYSTDYTVCFKQSASETPFVTAELCPAMFVMFRNRRSDEHTHFTQWLVRYVAVAQ